MAKRIGNHLRGNVIAYLALFFALGSGTAVAVTALDPNSVRSKHIVNEQVKLKDLAPWRVDSVIDADGLDGNVPNGEFTSRGGKLLILVSGSAFRTSSTFGEMELQVKLDGSVYDSARFFTNELNSHRGFVDAMTVVDNVGAGAHTLTLEPVSEAVCGTGAESTGDFCTTINSDDYFEASVIEFPG